MKKFLLSIFCCLMAFASVQAEETITFNFNDLYGSSTLSSITSKTVDGITISYEKNSASSNPGYNKDGTLRLYYASNGEGGSATFTTGGTKKITSAVITATTTPTVKYFVDGGAAVTGTWNSKKMTISNIQATSTFEIQNANTSNTQLRISSIVFTCEDIEGGETPEPEQPETPVAPTLPASWNLVEDVNNINVGDEIIIAYNNYGLGAKSNTSTVYHTKVDITTTNDGKALTDIGEAKVLTVGKNDDSYTFSYDGNYLYWSSGNSLSTNASVSLNSSWTIAIDNGEATISNKKDNTRKLQYNASSPRFACYTGTQQNVRIYKKVAYTLSVTDAGYATLFLDFNAQIPTFEGEDAGAYIVTGVKEGNWLQLVKVEGVLPANTGIIVKAGEGNYTFAYSAEEATADVEGNLLEGTVVATEIEEDAYVLGKVEGEVGLYKAEMAGGVWLNNANKAYLPASEVPSGAALSANLRFDFDGTTGVEKVEIRNEKEEIYDLTGRRVNEITKAGVYVVNGKKILVK